MDATLTKLLDGGHFYEGPRWYDGRWWVSDFYAHHVFTVTTGGDVEVIMEVPGQPSGLGWLPDGSLLVVSMRDGQILRRRLDGEVAVHADIADHIDGLANDMVVDSQGRAWVGNFGFDLMSGADPKPTNLLRVDPDGSVTVAATDMYFPNGSVIIDGNTLVVGETMGNRYSAFTIDPDGTLTNRRTWASFGPLPELGTMPETLSRLIVAPDGCGLTSDGHLWAADAVGARVVRVAPGESGFDESIAAPDGLGFFACAVGGPTGNTLLICAAPDFLEHARAASADAVLFTVDL